MGGQSLSNQARRQQRMKRAHSITFTLFIKPEEDKEQRKEQFLSLIPLDIEKEKLKLKETTSTGFNDRKITVLGLKLQKERHTNEFIDYLVAHLSGAQKQQLVEQENRLDDNCDYFLRFQKDHLPKLVLTEKGDCVHVKMSIAAFPKKKEQAKPIIKEIFK